MAATLAQAVTRARLARRTWRAPAAKPRRQMGRPIMIDDLVLAAVIQAVVACDQGLTLRQMFSRRRDPPRVRARHLAIALIDRMTTLSTGQIGSLFDFDHTSIIHALRGAERSGLLPDVNRLERLMQGEAHTVLDDVAWPNSRSCR